MQSTNTNGFDQHANRQKADQLIKVLAEVEGDFPGSPATLKFVFVLKDDAITRLEISA